MLKLEVNVKTNVGFGSKPKKLLRYLDTKIQKSYKELCK